MKIAIITPGGITNFGERAIMLGTIYDLRQHNPNAEIRIFGYQTLETDDPDLYQELIKHDVKFDNQIVGGKSRLKKIISIGGLLLFPKVFFGGRRYNYLKQAKVYSKGQESLTQNYGTIHFIDSFLEQLIVSRINKNIILYGHSIGPIYRYRKLCGYIVRRFARVYVRDTTSREVLRSLGYDERKIIVIKDLAYKAVEEYGSIGQSTTSSYYLLIPNAAICRTKDVEEEYFKNLRSIVEVILNKKYKLIVGSSVITHDWNNDYRLCEQLKAEYPSIELKHYRYLHEFLTDVKYAKKTISSRLHPLIMSTGLRVEVIALSRSPKVIGLLKDLNTEKSVVDPFQRLSKRRISSLL